MASDGTDPYVPEEPTEETTQPTEETTEPSEETTEPEEVTTEPAETETEAPATEQTEATETSEQTTAPAPTEEETVPDEARPEGGSGWIGLVIVGIVLTALAAGALIFKSSTRKGRYSGR